MTLVTSLFCRNCDSQLSKNVQMNQLPVGHGQTTVRLPMAKCHRQCCGEEAIVDDGHIVAVADLGATGFSSMVFLPQKAQVVMTPDDLTDATHIISPETCDRILCRTCGYEIGAAKRHVFWSPSWFAPYCAATYWRDTTRTPRRRTSRRRRLGGTSALSDAFVTIHFCRQSISYGLTSGDLSAFAYIVPDVLGQNFTQITTESQTRRLLLLIDRGIETAVVLGIHLFVSLCFDALPTVERIVVTLEAFRRRKEVKSTFVRGTCHERAAQRLYRVINVEK